MADDRDYDALPFALLDPPPPGAVGSPAFLRIENPMFVKAWKALYGYPHADASEAHVKDAVALKDKALKSRGAGYPAWVLDQQGVEIALANRVAMAPDLPAPRFRWVPYADALIFPLDNSAAKAANRDYAAFYPAEETLLQRYMAESGVRSQPVHARGTPHSRDRLRAAQGGWRGRGNWRRLSPVADFGPAAEATRRGSRAARGRRSADGGRPRRADYLFAYVARGGSRAAIHIHVANGGGFNYDQRGANHSCSRGPSTSPRCARPRS